MLGSLLVLLILLVRAGGQEASTVALGGNATFFIPDFRNPRFSWSKFTLIHPDQRELAQVLRIHQTVRFNCTYIEKDSGSNIIRCPINNKADYGRYFLRENDTDFSYQTIHEPACSNLPRPSHSKLNIDEDRTPGSKAVYTCNDGYIIAGTNFERNRTRLCQDDLTWSGTVPTCIKSVLNLTSSSITTQSTITPMVSTETPDQTVTTVSTRMSNKTATTTRKTPLNTDDTQNQTFVTTCSTFMSNDTEITTRETTLNTKDTLNQTFGLEKVTASETTTDPTTHSQVNVQITELNDQIEAGNITMLAALEILNTSTSNITLMHSDLKGVKKLLNYIVDQSALDSTNVTNTSKAFLGVTSNLNSSRTKSVWKKKIENGTDGAENVITLVDKMMTKVMAVETNESTHISVNTPEMYFEAKSTKRCEQTFIFPAMKGPNYIESECAKDQNTTRFSGVLYKDIGQLVAMTSDNFTGKTLQPTIIGFEQPGFDGKVTISIKAQKGFRDPVCVFLDFRANKLSIEGCRLRSFKSGTVKCECDHLTNFAVLMSPMDIDLHNTTVLNIMSMVGCIISIICLLVTMVVHVVFRRNISKDQDKIALLMTLCGVLIVTYIVFLAGIDKTDDQTVCTVIAVSLHFLLLSVFLLMLAEGIYHVKLVFKPRGVHPNSKTLVLISFISSIVFVGITAGASQLHGYGSGNVCWLSTRTGIKWTFIIPAALVVLVNIILTGVILWKINHLKGMDEKRHSEKIKKAIRDVVLLSSIFGFTWIFGLFSMNEDSVAFQYIFVALNSLQGFFIMLVHCVLNKKVRAVFKTRSQRRKKHLELSEQTSKPTTTHNRTGLKTELQTLNSSEVVSTSRLEKQ